MSGLCSMVSTGVRLVKTVALLTLISVLLVPAMTQARNANISSSTTNISESSLATEPGNLDRYAEIAVSGSNVHVLWLSEDAAVWDKHDVYYRRSTDGGATWEPKQLIYSAVGGGSFFDVANRRLAVDGQYVHIFLMERRTSDTCSGIFSFVVLTHFRSTDGGAAFETKKDAVASGCGRGLFFTTPAASSGKVTVGYTDYHDWSGSTDHYVKVLTSEDNGASFVSRTAFAAESAPIAGNLRLSDLKMLGDKIYTVFTLDHGYPGSGYGYSTDAYFAASSDRGATFASNLISVPSDVLDSNGIAVHKTPWLQDYNHVPKIGAVGDNVYVTWTGRDSDGVMSVFFRRSTNSGVNFENAINLSKPELPSGRIARWASETMAAQGNYVYVVFVAVDANETSNARVYARSSSDSGATFSAMTELSPAGDPYVGGGWWPVVQTDPSVASGAKVHALWNWATYTSSSDGGASFTGPIVVAPAPFSRGDAVTPQLAVASDGIVHFVVERAIYSSGTAGDRDIFYRRLAPPPAPVSTDSALGISADGYVERYDTMQVPASADTNFTSAMTAEAWIKPNRETDYSGSFIQKADPLFSYRLGQWSDGKAVARITTADNGYTLIAGDPIPNGSWTHVAMTYDAAAGADNFRVYVNGSLAGAQTATGNLKTGKGILMVGGNENAYVAGITVDELRLWNRALSQSEIAANMVKTLQGNESGLTAYYNFNGTTKDITGRHNDGVLTYLESSVPGVESYMSSAVTTTTSVATTTTTTQAANTTTTTSTSTTTTASTTTTTQTGGGGFAPGKIALGTNFTVAITADGGLWAWGLNDLGQLGDGTTTNRTNPVLIGTGFISAASGNAHTIALKSDGSLWAWGDNTFGQLGDGTQTQRNNPVQIGTGFSSVFAGFNFSAAFKSDGTLWAWGLNSQGQLGDGTYIDKFSPTLVGPGFHSLSTGGGHNIALGPNGNLWAWGMNVYGQIGNGTSDRQLSPVEIGNGFMTTAAGNQHSGAIKADGTLWMWGSNDSGQLGDGTTADQLMPKQVGSGYTRVYAGGNVTFALKSDQTLWAWGWNYYGAVGNGGTNNQPTPTQIGTDFVSVVPNLFGNAVVGIKSDGSLWAWGSNSYGQLGDGTTAARSSPVLMTSLAGSGSTTTTSGSTTTTSSTTTTTLSGSTLLGLISGWNLVGNGSSGTLDVAAAFGDGSKVTTVWKWLASKANWAFYTPTLADGGAAYATSKGYDFMTSVAGGEGFWVNAKAAFTASLPTGATVESASFQGMGSGWNLIAIGDNKGPRAFNNAISLTPPAAGDIPLNLVTLWAWDAGLGNWYFYAPNLDKSGGLANYITSKGYLDFGSKLLDPVTGFWVNKP